MKVQTGNETGRRRVSGNQGSVLFRDAKVEDSVFVINGKEASMDIQKFLTEELGIKKEDVSDTSYFYIICKEEGREEEKISFWIALGVNLPAPEPEKYPELPDNALKGLFSVSPTKKVCFSKGNLYWDGNNKKFGFENAQYYFRHCAGWEKDTAKLGTGNETPQNTVGTFLWCKDAGRACAEKFDTIAEGKLDTLFCASNFVIDGIKGWRTLTRSQCSYLTNEEDKSKGSSRDGKYKSGVKVCGGWKVVWYWSQMIGM